MASILVVDDELSMREFLSIFLEKQGYKVATAADGEKALKMAQEERFDLAISDIRMPGLSGLELLAQLKPIQPDLAFILITAFASPGDAVMAMKNGCCCPLSRFQACALLVVRSLAIFLFFRQLSVFLLAIPMPTWRLCRRLRNIFPWRCDFSSPLVQSLNCRY